MPSLGASLLDEALKEGVRLARRSPTTNEESRTLDRRIKIAVTSGSPPGLIAASQQDPFIYAGNYALGWTYFCLILLVGAIVIRIYHKWTDKIRRALHKEARLQGASTSSSSLDKADYEMANYTNASANRLFPRDMPASEENDTESSLSTPLVNKTLALFRWIFYRPTFVFTYKLRGRRRTFSLPNAAIIFFIFAAFAFTMVYTFLPQPYFYESIEFGSPPLAIRAGMLSCAMIPWIIALSMKANLVSLVTGIGHERLGVLHRWMGYICLALAVIHTVPFYVTPVWESDVSVNTFLSYFRGQFYIYGTGIAALAPLGFLCIHSLPFIRARAYELFVALHIPASVTFVGMMIWHCNNALTSWAFLWATVGIWALSLVYRLYYLNWSRWWRQSFLCGEEASIVLLPENAIKITVPTQMQWNPGQFVYIRIPGISFFENHPFTIASLCSEEFTSDYGEEYRDLVMVFRPFGGFTRKVANAALRNGPEHTYRAFLDGPYGGMQRELTSFDTVVMIAGGSGITAIISQLLLLIKKMRDGTAVTKNVHVVWALKRPETAEWFREELRICRQFAPLESVHCQFFITAAKRQTSTWRDSQREALTAPPLTPSAFIHDRIDAAFAGIASKRNSALIRDEAQGDPEKEKQLTAEGEDDITALPQAHLKPQRAGPGPALRRGLPQLRIDTQAASSTSSPTVTASSAPSFAGTASSDKPPRYQHFATTPTFAPPPRVASTNPRHIVPTMKATAVPDQKSGAQFDFGFPSTPTALQKNLVRFAFMPGAGSAPAGGKKGWHTEYGRPDLSYMLRQFEQGFGRRTAVFVCGPPSMRHDVKQSVARMQQRVLKTGSGRDEIFLWGEEYAL